MMDPQQEHYECKISGRGHNRERKRMMDSCLGKAHISIRILKDAYQVDDANKSAIFGMVPLTVHVAATRKGARYCIKHMLKIKGSNATKSERYAWDFRNGRTNF